MIDRIVSVPEKGSYFLFGARQTGKTTFVSSHYQLQSWTVSLLNQNEYAKYSRNPHQFYIEAVAKIESEGVQHIILDEVQKLPSLLDEVHSLLEKYAVQFVLLGSSARKLRRGSANLLAGRAVQRYLYPLTWSELKQVMGLEDILRFGTLPPVTEKSAEERTDFLRTYADTYLREEIQMEGLVRNMGGFYRFLDVAASQCGEMVNFSAVSREAGIPQKTVESYFQILEDTLIGIRIQPYYKSIRKRLVSHPRFYLFDTGVTNSINGRLTANPDPKTAGRLFEQFIILEVYRHLQYGRSESRLYFWRTHRGLEVDFIIERHGEITGAYEIKNRQNIAPVDLKGLLAFHDEHPEVPLFVISRASQRFKLGDVTILPWQEFIESMLPEIQ